MIRTFYPSLLKLSGHLSGQFRHSKFEWAHESRFCVLATIFTLSVGLLELASYRVSDRVRVGVLVGLFDFRIIERLDYRHTIIVSHRPIGLSQRSFLYKRKIESAMRRFVTQHSALTPWVQYAI